MKARMLFLLLAALCITAIPVFAGPTQITLTSVGGASQGGVYVAPYYLSVNGGTPIEVICDDYTHSVYVGESWTATLQTFASLGGTRFGAGAFQQYAEAAWLFTQFLSNPSKAGDINFAVWDLFSPSAVQKNTSGWTSGAQNWLTAAQTWFSQNCTLSTSSCQGINLSAFVFITPTNLTGSNSPQECIEMTTPEPVSIALFAVGLLFLGLVARKLSPSQASS